MGQNWKKLGDISDREMTPMLRQYIEAKAECGDSILFFRLPSKGSVSDFIKSICQHIIDVILVQVHRFKKRIIMA